MSRYDVSLQNDVADDANRQGAHFAVNLVGHGSEGMAVVSFSATVKGVRLYDLGGTRAIRGEEVCLQRNPSNAYDANCVDVCLKRGYLLGHLEARVAAVVGPLMDRLPIVIDG